jgi:hypothetical protein
LQALFAPGDLRGHVHAIGQCLAVAALGQIQQALHLLTQLRLDLARVRP